VIGERIVTPQALVHLVLKLRISPPAADRATESNEKNGSENRPTIDTDEEARREDVFLNGAKDVEDLKPSTLILGSAHAPLWPSVRFLCFHLGVPAKCVIRVTNPVGGLSSQMSKVIDSSSLR
jgi:hypothetical protein